MLKLLSRDNPLQSHLTRIFNELIEKLMQKPIEEMQELYNHRDIEK